LTLLALLAAAPVAAVAVAAPPDGQAAAVDGAASAGTAADLARTLDALAAAQRPAGGWAFSPVRPGGRPPAFTIVMRIAERIAYPLGLARWDLVVLRSPGTPLAGIALLGGWRLFGEARWLDAARRAGDVLVAIQLEPGGWFSEMPVEDRRLAPWFPWVSPRIHLDDDVTPGATRFLLALWLATGELRYRRAAERGLALLLDAQLASGAWPLVRRPRWLGAIRSSREDRPSLNDGATPLVIETLVEASSALGRPELLAAARRGGDWLLAVQGTAPQAGWAQQYDDDGQPAPMRAFEPAALATWETRHAGDALDALARATGDDRWCPALRAAGRWLAASALRPGCWPRFAALGTNAPLFADAGGRLVGAEAARPGYDWTGDFGIPSLLWRLGRLEGPPPPARAPGDPGSCPDVPQSLREPGDPRLLAAEAAVLLSRLVPPPRSPCGS